MDYRHQFLQLAMQCGALRLGDFTLKSGRSSPYFFNAGLFYHGDALSCLSSYYADALQESNLSVDMLFGPAYKGITLVASLAIELSRRGVNLPYAFNRKEVKEHGEGGMIIGAPLTGRVLIVDDVITAGTSVHDSVRLICDAGATPVGVLIALDRQEAGLENGRSAVAEVQAQLDLQVVAIASFEDLLEYIKCCQEQQDKTSQVDSNWITADLYQRLMQYKSDYGVGQNA